MSKLDPTIITILNHISCMDTKIGGAVPPHWTDHQANISVVWGIDMATP